MKLIGKIIGGFIKAFLLIVIIYFVISFVFLKQGWNFLNTVSNGKLNSETAKAVQSAIGTKSTEKPVEVSATNLFDAYQGNGVKADSLYKGKTLLVSGTISGIDVKFGTMYVRLSTSNQFMPVDCAMKESEKEKVEKLEVGSTVTIKGIGDGETIGRPSVDDCEIVQ